MKKDLKKSLSSVGYLKPIISLFYSRSSRRYSSSSSAACIFPDTFSNRYNPFYQSEGLQHRFKNWQHLRKNKLTASTFASAVGFWPRGRARLWLEKLGTIEPFPGNDATCWSHINEEVALQRYKLMTRNAVCHPEFQIYVENNPEDNWLAASPDGVVYSTDDLSPHGVLEIKCQYLGNRDMKVKPWKRIPLYYIPQAQGLMEILDLDWLHLYMWTRNRNNLGSSLFTVYRDKEYWDVLKIALSDFWWNHVQPAKEICSRSVITNPLIELKLFRPAPKHELHQIIVHLSKRVLDESVLLVREIDGQPLSMNCSGACDRCKCERRNRPTPYRSVYM